MLLLTSGDANGEEKRSTAGRHFFFKTVPGNDRYNGLRDYRHYAILHYYHRDRLARLVGVCTINISAGPRERSYIYTKQRSQQDSTMSSENEECGNKREG